MTVYLDCNATTPIEPLVKDEVVKYMVDEFGNAGSRTHEFGNRAKKAVQRARERVASIVDCESEEVIFTSGATESNNIALLGLEKYGVEKHKKHIISTTIEHKAVLEPLMALREKGFEITLVSPKQGGWIEAEEIRKALRGDTLLVSVMQVNNETGVLQPIQDICQILTGHSAFFHVDAAQGFGKQFEPLKNKRVDFISISGHKIYGPKGIGSLVMRKRRYSRPPLKPIFYGGGQERNLRPGTLPVQLIVGLGKAAELAEKQGVERAKKCSHFREKLLAVFKKFNPHYNGDQEKTLPHIVNLSIPGVDAEALMVALKDVVAISNGSACTSQSYKPSHVLQALGLSEEIMKGAIRISWCHMTEEPDWNLISKILGNFL